METNAIIGELYRELRDAKEAGESMIALIGAIKDGKVTLDRIEVTADGKVKVSRPKEVPAEK